MDLSRYLSAAAATPPALPAAYSTGYPSGGNPAAGTPATAPGPYWYYQIQAELTRLLTDAGVTPSRGNLGQLSASVTALAAAQAASALTAMVSRTWYVDSEDGDDANAGTSANVPLKTLDAALAASEQCRFATINLACDGSYSLGRMTDVTQRFVSIYGNWVPPARTGASGTPTITQGATANAGGTADRAYSFRGAGGRVALTACDLVTAVHTVAGRPWDSGYGGLCVAYYGGGSLRLSTVNIELRDAALFDGGSGYSINISVATVTRLSGTTPLIAVGGTLILSVYTLTLLPGGALRDWITGLMRAADSVPHNVICNVALT